MSADAMLISARVGACLTELGLAPVARRGGGWTVELPSLKRGGIGVAVVARERTVRMVTFLMRAPDRERETVYRRMLERNLQMVYWRFGVDPDGDLFLATHLDDDQLGRETLDAVLGLLVTYVDETYEGLVRLGFDVPAHIRVGGPPPTGDVAS
jgi:Putative bacterial sensory transduction regulator